MRAPLPSPQHRYTGYIKGLGETYRKTPVMAQVETRTPEPSSFLFTRTVHPKAEPAKDPCNNESSWRDKGEPDNLWPILQAKAAQDSAKPPISNITLGDQRLNPFLTSYGVDFGAPFANHSRLRSPMRNKEIATTTTDLRAYYASSFNRVGE